MLYDNQNSAYVPHRRRRLEESIFTVNDTLNAVAHVRDAYFSIKDVSVATYEYHYAAPTIVQPMLMSVTQYKNKTIAPPQHYNITPTSLGPFDDLDTTETALVFLHSLVTIEFSFPLRDIDYGPFYVDCFDWTVRLTLAMHENSHFRLVRRPKHDPVPATLRDLNGQYVTICCYQVGVSPVFFGYALFGSIVFGYRVDGFGGIPVRCWRVQLENHPE
ncbi:hypothetical protein DYB32_007463 [Aphanomyces invadans]|uniref:Uncharacterized protein n=1 Tax=Aphanomyces invadans TaxID=157072 RepID=A0A418ANY2_9STRA|nr:hypothetical protein DYB32_007463 [Aphanomyces invadans]